MWHIWKGTWGYNVKLRCQKNLTYFSDPGCNCSVILSLIFSGGFLGFALGNVLCSRLSIGGVLGLNCFEVSAILWLDVGYVTMGAFATCVA